MGTGPAPQRAAFRGTWLDQGWEALERGDLSDAIESLRHALEVDPRSISAHLYLGTALAMDAQVYEAIDVFEAGLALSSRDFMLNFKVAELYFRLCVPDKGHVYLRVAQGISSTSQERQLVRTLRFEETDRAKRRIHRPSFTRSR